MNIFVVDPSPLTSAKWLWDRDFKRANKMILESTQMLCTALNVVHNDKVTPYRSTHINHPCNVWVREVYGNWYWLLRYVEALAYEFEVSKGRKHKCESVLWNIVSPTISKRHVFPDYNLPYSSITTTPFVNCARNTKLGLDFTHLPVFDAYKQYLEAKWRLENAN